MKEVRFLRSLHFKIASGVIATVILSSAIYFVADYRSTRSQLFADLQESANQMAGISRQALLELAMLGRHPQLLQESLERLAQNSDVEQIFLMDMQGSIHFSSDPVDVDRQMSRDDVGCRVCHQSEAAPLTRSQFIDLDGRQYLRDVRLVPNEAQCHACHDPEQVSNGVLVIDFPTEQIWAQLRSNFYQTLARVVLSVLLILGVLGVLLNKLVIRPLQTLQLATVGLDQDFRAPKTLARVDELGKLARSFDSMRNSVRSSIEKLERQQAYLQHLINSLNDGLIVLNPEMEIEMTNRAADRICSLQQLEHLLSMPIVKSAIEQTRATGEWTSCELQLDRALSPDTGVGQSEARFVDIQCSPVSTDDGEADKVILLVRDVTRRKRFQAQASRAERLASVGQLAAGLAHEINNPMAAITTCVEGLNRHVSNARGIEEPEKKEIREYLSTVAEAAMRCKTITQQLLGASSDEERENFEEVDLPEVIRDTLNLIRHEARKQHIQVQFETAESGTSVHGDRQKLSQLLLNLLLNSLEASAAGTTIGVELESLQDFVQLSVSDTGCGIPENLMEKIFDPFFTTKPPGKGTGLGLSVCQWIVRQHGGRFHVQSSVGEGTTFSILFPIISGKVYETTSRIAGRR